jgi:hypothetical protein
LETNKFNNGNLRDFDCGSGFQPRLCDDSYKATFFRGWKPLPREIDVNLMTLTRDLLKFRSPRVLMRIAELRSDPPLMGADPALKHDVALARQKLWTLYRAGYYAYTGETDRWESMIKRLLPEMRDNPYFR